jgi:hypothetical protein
VWNDLFRHRIAVGCRWLLTCGACVLVACASYWLDDELPGSLSSVVTFLGALAQIMSVLFLFVSLMWFIAALPDVAAAFRAQSSEGHSTSALEDSPSTRSWRQFTLRSLFRLTSICCVLAALAGAGVFGKIMDLLNMYPDAGGLVLIGSLLVLLGAQVIRGIVA